MARNRSEKEVSPDRRVRIDYLEALRALVKANLDAGAPENFGSATSGGTDEVHAAWRAYLKAEGVWDGFNEVDNHSSWPAVLRAVEANVKKYLHAT